MLLNKTNIKNKLIVELVKDMDVPTANKFIWKDENSSILKKIVAIEEGRLEYFKTSPITNIQEVFKSLAVTYKFLSDWDKEFITDMIDRNNYSIKQRALVLRIANSINYSMWKNNLNRDWLWNQIKEDEFATSKQSSSYNIDEVEEVQLTDETELIADFKILKDNFDDIMESKLFDHQISTVNFLMTRDDGNGIIGSSTGTGKTLVGITYSEQLFLENKIEHTYIICPLAMVETWKREILKHSKFKDLSRYTVINYEKLMKYDFANANKSLVLLDEGHKLKNSLSKRYKEFKKHQWKYVVPLSATIIGNRTEELKNIYGLLNKTAPIKRGEIDLKRLKEVLIRVPKSKLNLPSFTTKNIPIELNFKDEYSLFEEDVLRNIEEEKEIAVKEGKRPPNALVKLLRLNQYSSNRNIIMEKQYPVEEQNKFKVMFELIDDSEKEEQFIVWSNFVDSIQNIYKMLSEYFDCEYIDGSVKQEDRDKLLDKFRDKNFKVLIANPSTLNAGVTLVNASKMIYFDRDFSSIKYIQAQGRIFRIGQQNECIMYNLFYKDSIEEHIINVLDSKSKMIEEILENGSGTDISITKDITDKYKIK